MVTGCSAKEGNNESTTDVVSEIDGSLLEEQTLDNTYWENADSYTWRLEEEGKIELPAYIIKPP